MPDEYVLRLEASGEVTPAQPEERRAAKAYGRALSAPPSAEASAYILGRLAASRSPQPGAAARPDDIESQPEEAEQ